MEKITKTEFDHEKLIVYERAITFAKWVGDTLEHIPARVSARDQLERASTSIALNIAEGNGKYAKRDRCRFFDIAQGSAVECAAALDVLKARGILSGDRAAEGKSILVEIVAMLVGLLKAQSTDRIYEDDSTYLIEQEQD